MKLLFACFVVVLVTWMSFASGARELRRGALCMLETYIMMSSLIFHLILILMLRLALPLVHYLISLMDLTIAHMVLIHERTTLCLNDLVTAHVLIMVIVPPRRLGFSAGEFHTYFEPRHLHGPRFPRRSSHPTCSNGDVQKIVKTSSGPIVK
jgi:hypothetical protein